MFKPASLREPGSDNPLAGSRGMFMTRSTGESTRRARHREPISSGEGTCNPCPGTIWACPWTAGLSRDARVFGIPRCRGRDVRLVSEKGVGIVPSRGGVGMSQRFIRCSHCGLPHDVLQVICPSTGKAIRRDKSERLAVVELAPLAPSAPPPRIPMSTFPPRGPSRDLFGKQIGGKYVVRAVLGEGGMGTVFEAEHLTIGRSVAVKVLHPNQARKKDAVRRFHQEARAAGAIGHPNICEVYDLGTLDDGSPYLVMEKLVGETLADRIGAEGGLPFDDVIDTLVQVLSGLVAAHEKGIVHRDIKPENVFLTSRVGCPPLVKLLATLPVLGENLWVPPLKGIFFKGEAYSGGQEWLARNDGGSQRLVFRIRMAAALLAVALSLVIFFATREWFGTTASLVALTLVVFDPNILATPAW